jgi:hypothetical protein
VTLKKGTKKGDGSIFFQLQVEKIEPSPFYPLFINREAAFYLMVESAAFEGMD